MKKTIKLITGILALMLCIGCGSEYDGVLYESVPENAQELEKSSKAKMHNSFESANPVNDDPLVESSVWRCCAGTSLDNCHVAVFGTEESCSSGCSAGSCLEQEVW